MTKRQKTKNKLQSKASSSPRQKLSPAWKQPEAFLRTGMRGEGVGSHLWSLSSPHTPRRSPGRSRGGIRMVSGPDTPVGAGDLLGGVGLGSGSEAAQSTFLRAAARATPSGMSATGQQGGLPGAFSGGEKCETLAAELPRARCRPTWERPEEQDRPPSLVPHPPGLQVHVPTEGKSLASDPFLLMSKSATLPSLCLGRAMPRGY